MRIVVLLLLLFTYTSAFEKDLTFTVQAGKIDCFYHQIALNHVIDLEYQVIDSSHGDLDISFQLNDPSGRMIVSDYKKPENSHRHTSTEHGDYKFCFDNTFSTFSTKTVFFDLMINSASEEHDPDYDDEKEMELGNTAESYMMRVRDIAESVSRVRDNMALARRLQELHSAHEARDRNLAEDVCYRVLTWSMWQIFLMMMVGCLQVIFVRSLFEDQRASYKKFIPGFASQ